MLTNGTAGATPRKKKGKKKKKVSSVVQHADDEFVDDGLAADLACINEDIIHGSELKDEPLPLATLQNKPNLRSEPTPKVYIEVNSKCFQYEICFPYFIIYVYLYSCFMF